MDFKRAFPVVGLYFFQDKFTFLSSVKRTFKNNSFLISSRISVSHGSHQGSQNSRGFRTILRAFSHTPVPVTAPDSVLSNGVFQTLSSSAEMPAPAPTFGNAAGGGLDVPKVGTTAGLSITMFLNELFHTQVKSCR